MAIIDDITGDARECFKELEIKFEDITIKQLAVLRDDINDLFIKGENLSGKLRTNITMKHKFDCDGNLKFAEITCRAGYFKKRTCVIFEENGFIGFCGWADRTNTKPVTDAFKAWCWKIAGGKI